MTISPTALHGPKGRSRQDTHQRLITHSPSDQHQRHISLHLHNHTDSNCPSQHLQDYTLLFGSLLNSTPLFSLVLATSMLSLKLASFPPMPSFSNLSPQQNCCPVSLPHLDLKLEIMPALVIPLRLRPAGATARPQAKFSTATSLLVLRQFVMLAGPFPLLSFPSMLKLTQVNLLCRTSWAQEPDGHVPHTSKDEKKGGKRG